MLGVAPGTILAMVNYSRFKRTINEAQAIASDGGERLDFDISKEHLRGYVFRPGAFVSAGDSAPLRSAKALLLSVRAGVLTRHALAVALMFGGAALGTWLASTSLISWQ